MKSTANTSNPKRRNELSRKHTKSPSQNISLKKNNTKSYQTMQMSDYSTADQQPNSNNSYVRPYTSKTINHDQLQKTRMTTHNSSFNNKIKPTQSNSRRSKSKPLLDINQIKAENKKEFFHSLTNDYTITAGTSVNQQQSKVALLEQMIFSIKDRAKKQSVMSYNDLVIYKDELEQSIECLKCKIAQVKADQKYQVKDDIAMKKQINALRNRLKDNRPNPNCDNDVYKLRNEIENMQRGIAINRHETREIGIEIQRGNVDLNEMHEYKKKINKMISDKEKEKENFLPAIKLMKKHIVTLKQKLQAQLRTNNDFTNKLSSVVEGGS